MNNIVAFNAAGVLKVGSATPTLRSNCIYGNRAFDWSGFATNPIGVNGNISENPQFVNLTAGDLHLFSTSPCVDTGDNSTVLPDDLDLDGKPRIQNARVDMGAYERQPVVPDHLVFLTQPGGAKAGAAFAAQPKVAAVDADGNTVTTFTGPVTVGIKSGTGASGAVISGTVTVSAVSGVATFSGLAIDRPGTGYVLEAESGSLTPAESAPFDVAVVATRLVFSTQPGGAKAGLSFTTQPVVQARDAWGNIDPAYTASILVSIKTGTGTSGAVLSGTRELQAVNGVATFTNLSIDRPGAGYVLRATTWTLPAAESLPLEVKLVPTHLAFTVQPASARAGSPFGTQPQVRVLDAFGTTDTSYTGPVTLAIRSGTGTSGATLLGTRTVNAVNGVASFAGLSIDRPGTGYVLTATSGTLASADSASFTVAVVATRLAFSVSPGSARAGFPFGTQPQVRAVDAWGNTDTTFTGPVALSLKSGTGTSGAALSGTATVNAMSGVATFTNLSVDRPGTDYVLRAASGSLAAAESSPFDVAVVATRLVFTTAPGGARAGLPFAIQPVLEAQDAWGNRDTDFSGTVTVAIKAGTGTSGASLMGTASLQAAGGRAAFLDLAIDRPGSDYVLRASSGTLTPAESISFAVAPVATRLVFEAQPGSARAGQPFASQPVLRAVDAWGNTDPAFTGPVTLSIQSGTGGAVLSGSTTVNAADGVATFTGLSIDRPGTAYVLRAASGALTPADSAPFYVAVVATRLAFAVSPASTREGVPFGVQPVVRAVDAWGNTDLSFAGAISLAIQAGTGASGATLAGVATVNAAAGVASFSGLSIDRPGSGYVLTAASGSLFPAESDPFEVAVVADRLVFTVSPAGARAGFPFTAQPVLQAQDAFGNVDPSFTGTVTLSIQAGTSGATLSGAASVAAVNGTASFAGLSIDRPGSGYVLRAAGGSLAPAESVPFDVAVTATRLVFEAQPGSARAGSPFGSQPRVAARDAFENVDTGFTGPVTLSIKGGTGAFGAGLLGTVTVNAVDGIAAFSGVGIDRAGTGYVLLATNGSLSPAESAPFDVVAVAARLAFTTQPVGGAAGSPFAVQPAVAAVDSLGNTDASFTGPITLTLKAFTGTAGAKLSGTLTVNAVNGIATFTDLAIDEKGADYVLVASSGGLAPAESHPLSVPLVADIPVYHYSLFAPSLDGHLGYQEWYGAPKLLLGRAEQDVLPGRWTGPADYTGQARVMWDENNLYFALEVTDDILSFPDTTEDWLFARDGVEIFLGPGSPEDPNRSAYGPGDAQILVSADEDASGNLRAHWWSPQAPQITGNPTSIAIQRTADGYVLEGAIPWNLLPGGMAPQAGQTIRFNLMAKDLDRATAGEDSAFSLSGLELSNANPSHWTTAVLQPEAPVHCVGFKTSELPHGYEDNPQGTDMVIEVVDQNGNRITDFNDSIWYRLTRYYGAPVEQGTLQAEEGLIRFHCPTGGFGPYTLHLEYLACFTNFAFTLDPVVKSLYISDPPMTARTGQPLGSVVTVWARNFKDQGIPGVTVNAAIKPGTGTPGAVLLGTTVQTTINRADDGPNGDARFLDLAIDRPGTGYELVFSTTDPFGNLVSVETYPFDVLPVATRLAFTATPGGKAGQPLDPAPAVAVRDDWGNTVVDFTGTVSLSLKPGTGTAGASLTGTTTVDVANGTAAFPGLSIDRAGSGYVLLAQSGSFSTESLPFDVASAATPASRVYGQADFASNIPNDGGVSPTSMALSSGLALDHAGQYVADSYNNRLLFFPGNDTQARRLYGQPAFSSGLADAGGLSRNSLEGPTGIALFGRDLYIADTANHRVLFYEPGDVLARRVYGQLGFTSDTSPDPPTSSSLRNPSGGAADASGVYIADTGNNRVLFFPRGSSIATRVYGQLDFTSRTAGVSATGLFAPRGLALGHGGLFVADTGNHRVLFFPDGSITATRVYGQPDITTNAPNGNGAVGPLTLKEPWGVCSTSEGVYIADTGNSRVLFYPQEGTAPTRAYGQADLVSGAPNNGGISAVSLNGPRGVVAGALGVFIADTGNHRVLGYSVSSEPSLVYGDADGDGNVSMADVLRLLQVAGGTDPADRLQAADVAPTYGIGGAQGFSDGQVDARDAARLLRKLQGLEANWP